MADHHLAMRQKCRNDANGEKLLEIERCQNPKWVNETTVACYEESVGSDAELKLAKKRTEFKLKKITIRKGYPVQDEHQECNNLEYRRESGPSKCVHHHWPTAFGRGLTKKQTEIRNRLVLASPD